jgi:ABC-type sulfate transport system permease component
VTSEPPLRRPPTFQPRFTLSLLYLFGFFLLYCLLFVAPELYEVLRNVPPGPEQEEAAREAAREAIRPRLLYALGAALFTTAVGARAGWLPGMRPPS